MTGLRFTGFAPEAFEFYEQLEADNTRTFWEANKQTYQTQVREPMAALCEEFSAYGPFKLYRPHNDLRFAKGRPPYKTHQGGFTQSEGGSGYYLHVSAEGMMAAAGHYVMARDQLERFRQAVDDDRLGPEVAALADQLTAAGHHINAMETLKSAPRGYPKDHPRIELLRRKGLMVSRSWPVAPWMHTRRVVGRIRDMFTAAEPLCAWLDRHVGPSDLPPDEPGR